ncbi:tyrosine-protein kinase Fer-like isoform X2 [Amphibalanus amphitrite]|nr:tyrosine-protein kinase Fer-like isoform X2 [Amphibalanus amphitrite]XP_043221678.1 tyrosine-protein kinase Fer-like isoform X2 [Amphibalanus amphitrite]XP_043221679.1 tyrosine-protein kinase Fer-like isoform X2 [Amphibalanus amphitrite]
MGFSSALQGRASHEALLSRQDCELRLMDTIRRCLQLRVRCDREYAAGLGQVVAQAQKWERAEDMAGSLIAQAWSTMMDETESLSRLMRANAETLATTVIDKLNALATEKRASRKIYQDEQARMALEITRYQESVSKLKAEYEKNLEVYKIAKARYEDQYVKGKAGRKLEEVKERYVKACRRLHNAHNEYVLLLLEASQYERDFRTVLLPALLEYQQLVQEDMIERWCAIMRSAAELTSFSTEKHLEIQSRVNGSISAITTDGEYREFTDRHKSQPPPPVSFLFDYQMVEEYSGRLKPEALAVDDLTIGNLRMRLADLETRLADVRTVLAEKRKQLSQHDAEVECLKKQQDSVNRLFVIRRASEILRKDIRETQCTEQKLQRLTKLIRTPLDELGGADAPKAVEDMGDMAGSSLTLSSKSHHRLANMIRKPFPFHRRPSPASSPTGAGPTGSPSPPVSSDALDDSLASLESGEERDGAPRSPAAAADTAEDSVTASQPSEGYQTMSPQPERPLVDEDWFHGVLPREEVVRLLVNDGDYLVRQTTRNDETQVVLSVAWGGHKHFIVQTTSDGQFRFEGPSFPTIQELISYQHECGLAVTNKSGAVLRQAILRERWELNNDDVELLEKIGRGNFGDVYKARLQLTSELVAVKTCKVTLPDEQKRKFLQEGRILKQYDHPNIVRFIGIAVQKQPIMIVMELVPGGSLLSYLRSKQHGSSLDVGAQLAMCRDTAAGMAYLEEKNCIHRDLAARNCLVGMHNMVKISDFGMSREEEEYIVSDGMKQIPIKWTAPEALNYGKYTSLCDVWSYGILAWEIFSRGQSPYSGLSNTKAREMIDSGYRMPAPDGTPDAMYRLMLRCWEYQPENRPHFAEIFTQVNGLFMGVAGPDVLHN